MIVYESTLVAEFSPKEFLEKLFPNSIGSQYSRYQLEHVVVEPTDFGRRGRPAEKVVVTFTVRTPNDG